MMNIIGKITIINRELNVSFLDLSKRLNLVNIEKIHVFSINLSDEVEIEPFRLKELPNITYIEIGVLKFLEFLRENSGTFLDWNPTTLYILRDGTYTDLKYIFEQAGKFGMNLGRGCSQKSHVVSPLDFRLSCYILAMCNFNFEFVSKISMFKSLEKFRYLPYMKIEINNKKEKSVYTYYSI